MVEPHDLSILILKQIRDELITTRTDLGGRIDAVRTELGDRIDAVRPELGARVQNVETVLLDLRRRFAPRRPPEALRIGA